MPHLDSAAPPVSENLQEPSGESEAPAWHEEVLAERLSRLDSEEEPISTWHDAKKRIREQTEGRAL